MWDVQCDYLKGSDQFGSLQKSLFSIESESVFFIVR